MIQRSRSYRLQGLVSLAPPGETVDGFTPAMAGVIG